MRHVVGSGPGGQPPEGADCIGSSPIWKDEFFQACGDRRVGVAVAALARCSRVDSGRQARHDDPPPHTDAWRGGSHVGPIVNQHL